MPGAQKNRGVGARAGVLINSEIPVPMPQNSVDKIQHNNDKGYIIPLFNCTFEH